MRNHTSPADFEIIVHRGHNLSRGENTLAGVEEIRALATDFIIEVDVCVTADGIPILHHDLTFDRLCGDSRSVAETAYTDLPARRDGEQIASLDALLSAFPEQRFLFDLRTRAHADFLRGSTQTTSDSTPLLGDVIEAVKKRLPRHNACASRLATGDPQHRKILMDAFPGYQIDLLELFTRDYLDRLPDLAATSVFGPDLQRMYIRFREVVPEVIAWAHRAGLKIIANHAPSRRSLENSRRMLDQSLAWGMDGLTASPIDETFVAIWKNATHPQPRRPKPA